MKHLIAICSALLLFVWLPFISVNAQSQSDCVEIVVIEIDEIDCYYVVSGYASFEFEGDTPPFDVTIFKDTDIYYHNPDYELSYLTHLNLNIGADGAFSVGNYSLQVINVDGCISTSDFYIAPPDPPIANVSVISAASCPNSCDGEVIITNSYCDGSCNISLELGDWPLSAYSAGFGDLITGLCPGEYSLIVIDSDNCKDFIDFTIPVAWNYQFDISSGLMTTPSCEGEEDGSINVTVVGGQAPYTYNWYGPNEFTADTEDIDLLFTGTYDLVVEDSIGCTTSETYNLLPPDPFELEVITPAQTCIDNGTIEIINVESGTPPYQHAINAGPFSDQTIFENLIAGTYTISTLDANFCLGTNEITLASPIDLSVSSTFANCDDTDGTATASVNQGAQITYAWNNGANTSTITDLSSGWYSVTVTDGGPSGTGCSRHENIEVLWDPNCYVTISGFVFNDNVNEACIADESVEPAANVMVALDNGEYDFTDENGYYEFILLPGTYEVSLILNNGLFSELCADPINIDLNNFGDSSTDNNFFLNYNGVSNLCISATYGAVRPGFEQTVRVYAYNYGNFPIDGNVNFTHDPLQTAVSQNPSATSYDEPSSTFIWDFENLVSLANKTFDVVLHLDETIPLGTPILQTGSISSIFDDDEPENNNFEINLEVTGAFDPNDKAVQPKGEGAEGHISRADSVLHYQVRFQNTGTDTAFTVVVLDTLDSDLNIRTLVPGASSHPYDLNVLDGNVLEFRFENIMLPDSNINEPLSHGFFLYDIHTKADLPYGTTFENSAAIYFDFNEPVITNTVVNTLTNPVGLAIIPESDLAINVQPNPTNDLVHLTYEIEKPSDITITLFDINGQTLTKLFDATDMPSGTHQTQFSLSSFPNGTYLVQIKTSNGYVGTERLIKIK